MAVINIDRCLLLVFVFGCCIAGSTEKLPCVHDDLEKCSVPESAHEACDGKLEEAKTCYETLTCIVTEEQDGIYTQTLEKIKLSLETCNSKGTSTDEGAEATTEPPAPDSCTDKDVDECKAMMPKDADTTKFCRAIEMAVPCLDKALTSCRNETTKKEVGDYKMELETGGKDKKCCNMKNIQKCLKDPLPSITNETASAANCTKLGTQKSCVEKETKTCKEAIVEKMMEPVEGYVDICEAQGYKVIGDNSGSVQQPALAVLLSVLLVNLLDIQLF